MSLPAGGAVRLESRRHPPATSARASSSGVSQRARKGEFGADTWPENARLGRRPQLEQLSLDERRGIVYIRSALQFDFYGGNHHGTTCSATAWWRSMHARASGCGTFGSCITISGTTICRKRQSS